MNQNIECIKGLKPERVWHYFGEISQIPHGSGNTKEISDYCVSFAKEHGLWFYQDEYNNVIIKKDASKGAENAPVTMLQGHLDMVCEKEEDCELDMQKDGLVLYVEGDYIHAEKTTLGGDDGIAIAMALAVLEDDSLIHPALEAVFTVDEETGMRGAQALDKTKLHSKYLLNLDSEEEGKFLCGCAGGTKMTASFDLETEKTSPQRAENGIQDLSDANPECKPMEKKEKQWYRLVVAGCQGGHSGAEIDKERANAIVLLGELLGKINENTSMDLAFLQGGVSDNAIARHASTMIGIPKSDTGAIRKIVDDTLSVWKKEYRKTDPRITVFFEEICVEDEQIECEKKSQEKETEDGNGMSEEGKSILDMFPAYRPEIKNNLILFLNLMPNGIEHFSMDVPGIVETSLNAGILRTTKEKVEISFCIRSMVDSRKDKLCDKIRMLTRHLGGTTEVEGGYPGWGFHDHSKLQECLKKVYERQYQKTPSFLVEHVGVECGLFMDAIEDLDGVSFGPQMYDIHTPKERMSISSVERVYQFLLEVLKEIAEEK